MEIYFNPEIYKVLEQVMDLFDKRTGLTELIYGAVDVLDSRYQGFKFTLGDVVSDNASAGAFYLGPIARRPEELELHLLGVGHVQLKAQHLGT